MDFNIVGCGVIGLTTGICLNISGYDTRIITETIPNYNNYLNKSDGKISTEYAAASVKPSTIDHKYQREYIKELLELSIEIFESFTDSDYVNYILHYLGGDDYKSPYYSNIVKNYRTNNENNPGNISKSAVFDCLFIDMPCYISKLIKMYEDSGGIIKKRQIDTLQDIKNPINCSGLGSKKLVNDHNIKPLKGYLAYVETDERIKKNDKVVSYAYNIDDRSVYMYPQKERIVLGGTAYESEDKNNIKYYNTINSQVPEHIIYENRKIIRNYFNLDIFDYDIYGVYGYRPYREGGLRIEKDRDGYIHNYGHGGCGVTLSWGSALKVCEIIGLNNNKIQQNISELIRNNR